MTNMFESYDDIVSVENLMDMLHIAKSTAYSLLRTNQIRHIKIGRKYIIPKASVLSFVNGVCYNDHQIINGRLKTVEKGETI